VNKPLISDIKEHLGSLLEGIPFVIYNYQDKVFDVTLDDITWNEIKILNKLVSRLRLNPLPPEYNKYPCIGEIKTGYYDRCLEHYCYQRLDKGLDDSQTCWTKNALQIHCVDRFSNPHRLTFEEKKNVVQRLGNDKKNFVFQSIVRQCKKQPSIIDSIFCDSNGWVFIKGDFNILPNNSLDRAKVIVKKKIRKLLKYPKNKNILSIINSVKKNGWNESMSSAPLCGVLGYSILEDKYHVLTGKHRIASMKYLLSRGYISPETRINYSVIRYKWGDWRQYSAPYSTCQNCNL